MAVWVLQWQIQFMRQHAGDAQGGISDVFRQVSKIIAGRDAVRAYIARPLYHLIRTA